MSRAKRLPGDARVADLAHANLMKQQRTRGPSPRALTPEQLQAAVRSSLAAPNPPDQTHTLSTEVEGLIQLRVMDVIPYDRNPRRHENECYSDIKKSIKASDVLTPIVVTRRPGTTQFMVGAGGNSRLRALQELWQETKDPRFEFLLGLYRPWVSELKTMVAHLAENDLRGGLTFWDRANAMWDLKREFEAEEGRALSLRQLREALATQGLYVSVGLLSAFGFAVEQLADLGPATIRLSKTAVQTLQPAFNQFELYLKLNQQATEWPLLRSKTLKAQANVLASQAYTEDLVEGVRRICLLDPDHLVSALERAVASHVGCAPTELRAMCEAMKRSPRVSLEELRLSLVPPALQAQQSAVAPQQLAQPSKPPAPASADVVPIATARPSGAAVPMVSKPGAVEPLDTETAAEISGAAAAAGSSSQDASADEGSTPAAAVVRAGIAFVRACGVADLFRECPALPHGYFMEVPPDGAFLEGFNGDGDLEPLRHGGWWIAAMYSGQIDAANSHLMPRDSLWRQLQLMENGHDETALQWHIETALGNPPGLLELGQWLLACPQHAADAHVLLLRALRRNVSK